MTTTRSLSRVGFASLLPLVLYVGCQAKKPTEIVVGVTTQIEVPKEIKAVGFVLQPSNAGALCKVYPVTRDEGSDVSFVRLPSTLAMVPSADAKRSVTTTVIGFRRAVTQEEIDSSGNCLFPGAPKLAVADGASATDAVIMRRSRAQYVADRILYNPMPLKPACKNVACPNDEQTCKAGKCVELEKLDKVRLRDYSPDLLFGTSNTCFRVNDVKNESGETTQIGCFNPSVTLPARAVNRADCIYDIPLPNPLPVGTPPPKGINVRAIYNDFATEILDLDEAGTGDDDQEGFAIPDPVGKPYRFKLAPGLCELTKDDPARKAKDPTGALSPKILQLQTSAFCLPKTQYQPICQSDNVAIQSNGSGGSAPPSAFCPTAQVLKPAPSSLYIVMDQSKSMSPFFGKTSVQTVLDLSLGDPALLSTQIAFKFAPAQASDCNANTPNSFATFSPGEIAFGPPENTRKGIVSALGGKPLETDDSFVFWDAVLASNGAYQALRALRTGTPVNRQALLLIGNRDFVEHCANSASLIDLATQARSSPQPVSTYVVLLGRRDGTDKADQAKEKDAGPKIAEQGGFFDASDDPSEGARALSVVVNSLSSCFYQAAGIPKDDADKHALSYLNFKRDGLVVTSQRVDIPFSADCTANSAAGASGFNLDADQRVRICGQACTDLRATLQDSAAFAALSDPPLPPPGVPIRVTKKCSP